MSKIKFDPNEEGGIELAREIVLERLRKDQHFSRFPTSHDMNGFDPFVDYIGDQSQGTTKMLLLVHEVLWEFIIQRILSPGANTANLNLPRFHITDHGKKVLKEEKFIPHDPTGYLKRFRNKITNPDPTIESYLSESLNCFTADNLVASVVMLGVASERAFLLLCESFLGSISNSTEKSKFEKLLTSRAIKPKMDWVINKIQRIQGKKPSPFPDNVNTMLIAIFDFIRSQRNDLGHPQEKPPEVTREQAYVNLSLFPSYIKMINQVITYLKNNKV